MNPADARELVRVQELSVDYRSERGEIHALSHVSFELHEGEVVAVVGESGCGKSTLALSLIRLLPVPPGRFIAGSVFFGETDMLAAHPREVQKIRGTGVSMIFQEPLSSLNPVLKVRDQLGEAIIVRRSRASGLHTERDTRFYEAGDVVPEPRFHRLFGLRALKRGFSKEVEEEVMNVLSLVRISDPKRMLDRYPFELSGGMRQRVMIAMALAEKPSLLIADEPTTALDVTTQAQVLKLMRGFADEVKTSLLLITHDLGVAAQVADRVLVMYAGEVVEDAEVAQLFNNPLHPYTRALLECLPKGSKNEGRLGSIPGSVPDLMQHLDRCPFADRCRYVFDRCWKERPKLEGDEKHGVACFLHSK